jgi:putative membrane protein
MSKSAGTTSSNIFAKVSPAGWAALILAIIAVIFVLQNRDSTSITLFWIDVTSPLWFTLLMIFVVGWVVGILMMRGRSKKKEAVVN